MSKRAEAEALFFAGNGQMADGDLAVGIRLVPGDCSSLLAGPGAATVNGPVDGITCDLSEMLAFHIHAHLAMHVDGVPRYLPAGVGIGPPTQPIAFTSMPLDYAHAFGGPGYDENPAGKGFGIRIGST